MGQVLCIVEAMKLMNEIESDVAGEVVKRIAASGQPVEYGQPLFAIRPNDDAQANADPGGELPVLDGQDANLHG